MVYGLEAREPEVGYEEGGEIGEDEVVEGETGYEEEEGDVPEELEDGGCCFEENHLEDWVDLIVWCVSLSGCTG